MRRNRKEVVIPLGPSTSEDLKQANPHVSRQIVFGRLSEWLRVGKVQYKGQQPYNGRARRRLRIFQAVREETDN